MSDLHRDIGRMESSLSNAVENIQEIKSSQVEMRRELGEIKTALSNQRAVKEWNWKLLGASGAIGGFIGGALSYLKIIFTHVT